MKIKILTTLSRKYWEQTGQYTVANWRHDLPKGWEFWLHDTPKLPVFADRYLPEINKSSWTAKAKEYVQGRELPVGYMKDWERFTHKSFAQWETYEADPSGILIWLDSDVRFKKPMNKEVILECLDGKFCGYFGRDRVNTEDPIFKKEYRHYDRLTVEGCVYIYNCDHPVAKDFFAALKNTYLSMDLFNYFDWCDTGAFHYTKSLFDEKYFNDITGHLPPVPSPLTVSVLDEYLEHWMGTANKKARADVIGEKEKALLKERGILK